MAFEDFGYYVCGGKALDDGDEFYFCSVAFYDFTSDYFVDCVVISFDENVGAYFADKFFGCGFVKDGDVIKIP